MNIFKKMKKSFLAMLALTVIITTVNLPIYADPANNLKVSFTSGETWNGQTLDMNYFETRIMEIEASFVGGDNTTKREIVVDIPKGYRLISYSVKEENLDNYTQILDEKPLQLVESMRNAIEEYSLTANDGSTYGSVDLVTQYKPLDGVKTSRMRDAKITYRFNGPVTVKLVVEIGIDMSQYNYSQGQNMTTDPKGENAANPAVGTGKLLEPLKVSMVDGTKQSSKEIRLNTLGTIQSYINPYKSTTEIYLGKDGKLGTIRPPYHYYLRNNQGNEVRQLSDEMVVIYKYPQGTSLIEDSIKIPEDLGYEVDVNHDETNREIIITHKKILLKMAYSFKIQPLFTADPSVYQVGDEIPFTVSVASKLYGENNYIFSSKNYKIKVGILNENVTVSSFENKMYNYNTHELEDQYQFISNFSISNKTTKPIENAPMSIEYEPGLRTKVVRVTPPGNGETLKEIVVYTNEFPEGRSLPDRGGHNYYGAVIDIKELSESSPSDYITKVEAVISKIPDIDLMGSGSASASNIAGIASYGLLVDESQGFGVTLNINGITAKTTTTTTESRIINNTTPLAKELNGFRYPGDKFQIEIERLGTGTNYYNRNKKISDYFLTNPYFHIIVPTGLSLDLNSIKSIFKDTDVSDKIELARSPIERMDGSIIYTFKFIDSFDVAAGYDMESQNNATYTTLNDLKFSFDLIVDSDIIATNSYNLRDIFLVEGQGNFIGMDGDEVAVVNNAPTDIAMRTGANFVSVINKETTTLKVQPLPELVVDLGIRIENSGEPFSHYNGTANSIATLSRDKAMEIEILYRNNANTDYASSNIYLPIPKKGADYGKYFNNKELSDPLNAPQSSPFTWGAKLSGAINPTGSHFEVYYAVDGSANSMDDTALGTYEPFNPGAQGWMTETQLTASGRSYDDVIFLKFVTTSPILIGESGTLQLSLTPEAGEPLDLVNYWRSYTRSQATVASNFVASTKSVLAATLVAGEIGGTVYQDVNGNGIYDAGDIAYNGTDVTLTLTEKSNKITPRVLTVDASGKFKVDTLQQGEYEILVTNNSGGSYHFTTFNVGNGTDFGSIVTPANNQHTSGKITGLNIVGNVSEKYNNVGVGLNSRRTATIRFEDAIANNTEYNGVITLLVDDTEVAYNANHALGYYMNEKLANNISVNFTASGFVHTGYKVYRVDSSGNSLLLATLKKNELTDYVFPFVGGNSIVIEATVEEPPVISLTGTEGANLDKYVGDNVNLLEGVSATDRNGTISLITSGANTNTTITQSIPVDSNQKYQTAGTYSVTITVTLPNGASATATRLVKVHQKPTVVAQGQIYRLSDDIITGVINNPSASWLQAPNTEGAATSVTIPGPAVTTVARNTISYGIISGPSNDFSKVGLYSVQYVAVDPNGQRDQKTVNVLVTDDQAITKDNLVITANSFEITNNEAASLTATLAKDTNHGNASAYQIVYNASNEITNINQVSNITVNDSQLASIKAASKVGGIYELTYQVKVGSDDASISVLVVVQGVVPPIKDGIAIAAEGFKLSNDQAKALTDQEAKDFSAVKAYMIKTKNPIDQEDITVDGTQLQAIKDVSSEGGKFSLTFTASDPNDVGKTNKVTVTVTVNGTNVVSDKIGMSGTGFILENNEAAGLDDTTAINEAQVKAWLVKTNQTVNTISVNQAELEAIQAVGTEGGRFPLTFTATEGDLTQEITIYVTVKGTGNEGNDTIGIAADGFKLSNDQAKELTIQEAKDLSNVNAYFIKSNVVIDQDDITVDGTQLQAIKDVSSEGGKFSLTFTAPHPSDPTKNAVITVTVTVNGTNVVSDKIGMSGTGFILENNEAAGLDDTTAINEAQVKAWLVKTNQTVNTISVNQAELEAIQAVGTEGGRFPLTFTATEGDLTQEITIYVTVKGTDNIADGDIAITAKDFFISLAQAESLTKDKAIEKANASAWLIKSNETVTNISVDATELENINKTLQSGIFDLTFIAVHGTYQEEITVKITVSDETRYVIEAKDAQISIEELKEQRESGNLESFIKEKTNAKGYRYAYDTGSEVVTEVPLLTEMSQLQNVERAGRYQISYQTIVGQTRSISATKQVNIVVTDDSEKTMTLPNTATRDEINILLLLMMAGCISLLAMKKKKYN